MSFTEATMQGLFTKWVKKNKHQFPKSAAFELKITKGKSLPFSRLEPHQDYYLDETMGSGTYHKISDQSVNMKPYDAFLIKGDAYIVIMFYEPKKPKIAYAIDKKDWNCYVSKSHRKSITEQDAKQIATKVITL